MCVTCGYRVGDACVLSCGQAAAGLAAGAFRVFRGFLREIGQQWVVRRLAHRFMKKF